MYKEKQVTHTHSHDTNKATERTTTKGFTAAAWLLASRVGARNT